MMNDDTSADVRSVSGETLNPSIGIDSESIDTQTGAEALQKIVDGLKEAMDGFAQLFDGISEQLAWLYATYETSEKKMYPMPTESLHQMPSPVLAEQKGAVNRPHKTPLRKRKAAKAEVEDAVKQEGDATEENLEQEAVADDEAATALDAKLQSDAESDEGTPNWPPNDTPPWEPPKEEVPEAEPQKAEAKPTEPPKAVDLKTAGATISTDDIRSVIVAKIKQKKDINEKVQSLLSVYGVKALSDLPDDKHEAFLADISQL